MDEIILKRELEHKPYIRTPLEELRYEFCRCYQHWIATKDDEYMRWSERESIWYDYCQARDKWVLATKGCY